MNGIDMDLRVMRDRSTRPPEFRHHLYCLSRDLAERLQEGPTWNSGSDIVLIPVLRAGIGMLSGAWSAVPDATVGMIGVKRVEDSGEPYHRKQYVNLPDMQDKHAVILDPMLATGGTALMVAFEAAKAGAARISIICAIAAPEGLDALANRTYWSGHGDDQGGIQVEVISGAVDDGLDDQHYIVPGLGDAGDRLFGVDHG